MENKDRLGDAAEALIEQLVNAQTHTQEIFLKVLEEALQYAKGQSSRDYIQHASSRNLALAFGRIKDLMWRKIDGRFAKSTFSSYFSVAKKCLIYNTTNWSLAKETPATVFEEIKDQLPQFKTDNGSYEIPVLNKDGVTVEKTVKVDRESALIVLARNIGYKTGLMNVDSRASQDVDPIFPLLDHYQNKSAWLNDVVNFISNMDIPTVREVLTELSDNPQATWLSGVIEEAKEYRRGRNDD